MQGLFVAAGFIRPIAFGAVVISDNAYQKNNYLILNGFL